MYLKKTFAFSVALICLALTICVASAAHSGVVYDREDSRHSHLRRGSVPPMQSLLHPPPHWMLVTLLMPILPSSFVFSFRYSSILIFYVRVLLCMWMEVDIVSCASNFVTVKRTHLLALY
eukprot:241770_1